MITEKHIVTTFHQVLKRVAEVVPLERWTLTPKGVDFTTEKTKYGLATPQGQVLINRAFIGTEAYTKLEFTLAHELAHLAVGLHHHHDRYFREMERAFGVDLERDLSDEISQVMRQIGFKYTLLAHLKNGDVFELGGVHRKSKAYTEYPKSGRYTKSIEGVGVIRFEYLANTT
ncbi:YgjP-like metallopeptidase domain-containing protein [Microbulbifer epialgicus]|uniref:YgjP-like metallopeptidase domain-containing protein n=1 Tax=Microbulbifer epialgicus TaxID=393907 RepID=A0ABV4NU86_9GAMM